MFEGVQSFVNQIALLVNSHPYQKMDEVADYSYDDLSESLLFDIAID